MNFLMTFLGALTWRRGVCSESSSLSDDPPDSLCSLEDGRDGMVVRGTLKAVYTQLVGPNGLRQPPWSRVEGKSEVNLPQMPLLRCGICMGVDSRKHPCAPGLPPGRRLRQSEVSLSPAKKPVDRQKPAKTRGGLLGGPTSEYSDSSSRTSSLSSSCVPHSFAEHPSHPCATLSPGQEHCEPLFLALHDAG